MPHHPSGDDRFTQLDRTIVKHNRRGDALIEVLHAAQGLFGYLDREVLVYVAHALKLPLSRVYGVATFYHYFTLEPRGQHTFVLCTGTACYVRGASTIQPAVEKQCGCRFGETTGDRTVSLVSARCIGSCGLAPVAVLDAAVSPRLTAKEAVEKLAAWREGQSTA